MNKIVSNFVFPVIVLALVIGIVLNLISCQDSANQAKKEKTESEKIKTEQIKQAISEMVARHNAIADWKKSFFPKDPNALLNNIYTIDLEAALVRSDNRPILFVAPVVDVERRDNKYFVHFQTGGFILHSLFSPDIHFVLECDSEQAKKIMAQQPNMFDEYAVVAFISSVRRAMFKVNADPVSSEEADLVVEPSGIFIVNGQCLELLFIGDYGISNE
ncbi:MAG TPA: hypothetical protein VFF49_00865 [Thermodesulfobacteriota bacterium]|nr:hypothetical protein [Thermodesulfobacteriota bacterium]